MKARFVWSMAAIAFCFFSGAFSFGQVNEPPVVMAEGDFSYCPLSQTPIVSSFSINDPDDSEIEAFFVQISVGYQRGFDRLLLEGLHPNVTTSWNDIQGKLTLKGLAGGPVQYADLIPAMYDIMFESSLESPIRTKEFSLTIGEANYLPQTGHYYEYVPNLGITWNNAKTQAEARTYFGLRGYLATVTSPEEAQLSGEQAAGAGWIGGSDAAIEGVWTWMTGPEAGTVFWNGGINGTTPNFAFWNTNEPNNCCAGEDYAHVTSPNVGIPGSWNDLSNEGDVSGDYQPKGYMVEYGGFDDDPYLQLSASTRLSVPSILNTTEAQSCGPSSFLLGAEASDGEVLWYDVPEGGVVLYTGTAYTTPILDKTTTYYVLASQNGCTEGRRTEVVATVHPLPIVESALVFKNCDGDGNLDGITDFNLNEATDILTLGDGSYTVSYHLSTQDADLGTNPQDTVPFSNALSSRIYARVENGFECYSVSVIDLEVSTTSLPPDFVAEIEVCDLDDPDGFYEFDLASVEDSLVALFPSEQNLEVSFYRSAENALLEENVIESNRSYRNENSFSQTLYIRIENVTNGACFGIGPHVRLKVLPLVDFSVNNEVWVCEGTTETVEITSAQGDYMYEWTNGNGELVSDGTSATFSSEGSYEVIAISQDGCISPIKTINVMASNAPNLNLDVVFTEEVNGINRIIIQADNLGKGSYEFSLDNPFGPFQDNSVFDDVEPGIHTVYAVDKNGCGSSAIEIGVIGISNFITPNIDGNNDFLEVLGVSPNTHQSVSLRIFDRYGKLLGQLDGFSAGWDGFYKNQQLPPSDYWYILEAINRNGVLQKKTGHFTLKR